jgi:hypothetical protein
MGKRIIRLAEGSFEAWRNPCNLEGSERHQRDRGGPRLQSTQVAVSKRLIGLSCI